eukprot:gene8662-34113_t
MSSWTASWQNHAGGRASCVVKSKSCDEHASHVMKSKTLTASGDWFQGLVRLALAGSLILHVDPKSVELRYLVTLPRLVYPPDNQKLQLVHMSYSETVRQEIDNAPIRLRTFPASSL